MTEAYTLKPCPFCGAEAEILREGTTRQSMRIACTNCNTEVESGDVIGLTPPEKWRWNQRVPVTVSEKGEAESERLLRVALTALRLCQPLAAYGRVGTRDTEQAEFQRALTDPIERIDAYLSRRQG